MAICLMFPNQFWVCSLKQLRCWYSLSFYFDNDCRLIEGFGSWQLIRWMQGCMICVVVVGSVEMIWRPSVDFDFSDPLILLLLDIVLCYLSWWNIQTCILILFLISLENEWETRPSNTDSHVPIKISSPKWSKSSGVRTIRVSSTPLYTHSLKKNR